MTFATLFPAGVSHAPVVYFLQLGNRVKIGTSKTLASRARSLSLGIEDVRLVMLGGASLEKATHDRYDEYRLQGNREWFELLGDLSDLIDSASALYASNPGPVIQGPDDQLLVGADAVAAYSTYADLYAKAPPVPHVAKAVRRVAPAKRVGSPEEIAAAVDEFELRTEEAAVALAHATDAALDRAKKAKRVVELSRNQREAAHRLGLDQSTVNKLVKKAEVAMAAEVSNDPVVVLDGVAEYLREKRMELAVEEFEDATEAAEEAAEAANAAVIVRAQKAARVVDLSSTQRAAAEHLGLDQSTVNKLIKRLPGAMAAKTDRGAK